MRAAAHPPKLSSTVELILLGPRQHRGPFQSRFAVNLLRPETTARFILKVKIDALAAIGKPNLKTPGPRNGRVF
jgi:hypothetical protein